MNAVDTSFDLTNRYNLWSGLIGGAFLSLSYFGTDQSQVQRYLTGRSVAQSRLGLLANGLVKVPMQFVILFVGAMVFAFYQFVAPPLWFNPVEAKKAAEGPRGAEMAQLEAAHAKAAEASRDRGPEARRGGEVGRRVRPRRREDLAARRPREGRRGEGARDLAHQGDAPEERREGHELRLPPLRPRRPPDGRRRPRPGGDLRGVDVLHRGRAERPLDDVRRRRLPAATSGRTPRTRSS